MRRKWIALLLALLMAAAFTVPAFADNTDQDDPETDPSEPLEQISESTTTSEMVDVLEDGTTVKVITSVTVIPAEEKDSETEPDGSIIILYTNDVHCGIQKSIGYGGLALLKNSLINAGKNVLLVDSGDALQGDTVGTLSKGEYIVDLMNKVGYDIATIGNHEFDYGMEQFFKNVEKAEFPYVCCNFLDSEGKPLLDSYRIFEIAGKKVAFVGVDTPTTFNSSTPAYFKDGDGNYIYSFCEDLTGQRLYDTVQLAVNGSIAEGADYVIVLAHLGINSDDSPWTSSELIEHTNGIDAVLDGHSHSVIEGELVKNKDGKNVLLTSTGTLLNNVGCLTIGEDGVINSMLLDEHVLEFGIMNKTLTNDGGVYELIGSINEEMAALNNTVIAHTDFDLITHDPEDPSIRIIRNQETNLGDLVADAYRTVGGADIGFINGGAIRIMLPAGDITNGNMISLHPFGNNLSVVEVTGQQILDALEFSAQSLPGEFGGFLHVSGLTYTVDLNVDSTVEANEYGEFTGISGERRIKDVKVQNAETGEYEPLDPEKLYTLAGSDYQLEGGDGYTMFFNSHYLQKSSMPDVQVLITYFKDTLGGKVPEVYKEPFGQGRIVIIEKAAEPEAETPETETEDTESNDEQPHTGAPELNG